MTDLKQLAQNLRNYNAWRRGDGKNANIEMPHPIDLGTWIDSAIAVVEAHAKSNVLARQVEKLEAERDALAAELKSLREQEPIAWFCHSSDGGYYEFSTFQAAAGCASDELAECRAEAKHDGEWPEDVVSIKFGAVLGRLTELKGETDGEGWVDYQLIRPVPAEPVNARLLEVLKKCRDQFEHYVSHHINKGEFEKAASNGSFVMLANAAISEAEKQSAEAGG